MLLYGVKLGTKDVLNILHYQNFLKSLGLIAKIKPQMTQADFARAMLSGRKKADYKRLEETIMKGNEPVVFKADGMTFIVGVSEEDMEGQNLSKEEVTELVGKALSPITNKYFSDEYLLSHMEYFDL